MELGLITLRSGESIPSESYVAYRARTSSSTREGNKGDIFASNWDSVAEIEPVFSLIHIAKDKLSGEFFPRSKGCFQLYWGRTRLPKSAE